MKCVIEGCNFPATLGGTMCTVHRNWQSLQLDEAIPRWGLVALALVAAVALGMVVAFAQVGRP